MSRDMDASSASHLDSSWTILLIAHMSTLESLSQSGEGSWAPRRRAVLGLGLRLRLGFICFYVYLSTMTGWLQLNPPSRAEVISPHLDHLEPAILDNLPDVSVPPAAMSVGVCRCQSVEDAVEPVVV